MFSVFFAILTLLLPVFHLAGFTFTAKHIDGTGTSSPDKSGEHPRRP
ncbi:MULTISPECIES: hypothetical protein [Cyanophyceae]|nr:hypothetical protein [Trichocoleus sp. FACHB-40]MBD2006355.1 hypothetical protein [Trichocoleus sp. FACHB-40]